MWYFLPSVLWHCWLGDRKDIWPVKSWMWICWWWRFDWSFVGLGALVVTTTTSVILSCNNIQISNMWYWFTHVVARRVSSYDSNCNTVLYYETGRQWRWSVVKYGGQGQSKVKSSNCFRRLEKKEFYLPFLTQVFHPRGRTWNLQSYRTTVLNERMWHFMGQNIYSDPSYIFRGSGPLNPLPGSTPLMGGSRGPGEHNVLHHSVLEPQLCSGSNLLEFTTFLSNDKNLEQKCVSTGK